MRLLLYVVLKAETSGVLPALTVCGVAEGGASEFLVCGLYAENFRCRNSALAQSVVQACLKFPELFLHSLHFREDALAVAFCEAF